MLVGIILRKQSLKTNIFIFKIGLLEILFAQLLCNLAINNYNWNDVAK